MHRHPVDNVGVFDARYRAYLEAVRSLRPALQRYCGRMVGSMLDGEDVVQEAIFEAYQKLDRFDDAFVVPPLQRFLAEGGSASDATG